MKSSLDIDYWSVIIEYLGNTRVTSNSSIKGDKSYV